MYVSRVHVAGAVGGSTSNGRGVVETASSRAWPAKRAETARVKSARTRARRAAPADAAAAASVEMPSRLRAHVSTRHARLGRATALRAGRSASRRAAELQSCRAAERTSCRAGRAGPQCELRRCRATSWPVRRVARCVQRSCWFTGC